MKKPNIKEFPVKPLPDNFLHHLGGAIRGHMKKVYQGYRPEHYPYYVHDVRMLVQGSHALKNLYRFIDQHKHVNCAPGPFLGVYSLEQYEITENTIGLAKDPAHQEFVSNAQMVANMSEPARNIT